MVRNRGEPPLGEVVRAREAEELAALRQHPAVASLLAAFPDAKIAGVRHVTVAREDEDGGEQAAG